jgi:putative transposase
VASELQPCSGKVPSYICHPPRKWLEYFGVKFGRITVAVNPAYTSGACSNCGAVVKKSLSMRTHACGCGFVLDRDWNAALNILKLALSTVGHTGTWVLNPNASGDPTSTLIGAILSGQVGSMNEESPSLYSGECQKLEGGHAIEQV